MSDEETAPETGASVRRGFVVRGRVQGVGFRWWTHRVADRIGVAGTVRNRGDGSVEVMAAGDAAAMSELERRLRAGPPMARVDSVDVVDCVLPEGATSFRIAG